MGKHRPPAKNIFAIIKSHIHHPLLPDVGGVEYTKVYPMKGKHKSRMRWWIVEVPISREEALELIEKNSMTKVATIEGGTIWETTPTMRSECLKLGLKYPDDLRPY